MTKTEERRRARAEELLRFDRAAALELGLGGQAAAGMDEAGRGPLAGPVVAACVVMPPEPLLVWVDDSKRLSEKRREKVFEEIQATALAIGVGMADEREIDEINILEATKRAMRRAAAQVNPALCLIDAVTGLGLGCPQIPVIHGDALSYAIAAASIVAKVTRDRLMRTLDSEYPAYGFAAHKGYGTAAHIEALRRYGPCPAHRRTFIGHFVEIGG